MPWEEHGGGYRKKDAPKGKGGFVKNPRQYEKLKEKYGKERAAAITNSFGKSVEIQKKREKRNLNPVEAADRLRRKKSVQSGLSVTGGTLGLSGLGAMAAGAALKRPGIGARAMRFPGKHTHLKNPQKTGQKLKDASTGLAVAGGGVGGAGALNFASIMRQESKQAPAQVAPPTAQAQTGTPQMGAVKKPRKKDVTKSAFGVEHGYEVQKALFDSENSRMKRNEGYKTATDITTGGLGAGAAVAGKQAHGKGFLKAVNTGATHGGKALSIKGGKKAALAGGLAAGAGAAHAGGREIKRRSKDEWAPY